MRPEALPPKFLMMLERVDRAISGQNVLVESPQAIDFRNVPAGTPAWTDGSTIWIDGVSVHNELRFKDVQADVEDLKVAIYRALNYHELGHVMFTPRINQRRFLDYPADDNNYQMLLALEEGRIETMFSVGKAAVAKILEISFATLVHTSDQYPPPNAFNYVLELGREYLVGQYLPTDFEHYELIKDLTAQYNRLRLPGEAQQAFAIAEKLAKLLPPFDPHMNKLPDLQVVIGQNKGLADQPDPDAAAQVREINQIALRDAQSDSEGDQDQNGPEGPQDAGNATEGQIEAPEGKADEKQPDNGNPGPGDAGKAEGKGMDPKQVQAMVDVLLQQNDVQELIEEGKQAIKKHVPDGAAGIDRVPIVLSGTVLADDQDMQASNQVVRAIRRMVAEVEQERRRRQYDGQIDLMRFGMTDTEMDVFRGLVQGHEEEIPIDVVFALDCSSSMRGPRVTLAAKAAWMMHHAAHAIPGSQFAAMAFNVEHSTIIKRGVRPTSKIMQPAAKGGTRILPLLQIAAPYLAQSRLNNKFLIVASDGQWTDPEETQRIVQELSDQGVVTMHFHIGSVGGFGVYNYFDHTASVQNPMDIAEISIKAFTERLRRFAMEIR